MTDVSIIIVSYDSTRLVRQTLKGIRRAGLGVGYEVILSENHPDRATAKMAAAEFPEVRVVVNERNLGFGAAMNRGIDAANGRYLFVFNPDIVVRPGAVEELLRYLETHPKAGMVGPQLLNPDGTLQHSCYRFMRLRTILYRRLPLVRRLAFVRRHLDAYVMADWDHADTREVDYVLGAAMLVRRKAIDEVGAFDPRYFMYFEDQDLCRRFWKAGWRVVYHPKAQLIHYHRRETAHGSFFQQLVRPLTWVQIRSAARYFWKHRNEGRRGRTSKDARYKH